MIRNIFFDLDSTLLPMKDQDEFVNYYLSILSKKVAEYGIEPREFTMLIFKAVKQMASDEGAYTNEEIFFKMFEDKYPGMGDKLKPVFLSFYANEFNLAKCKTYQNEKLINLVKELKGKGFNIVLATSPFFPRVAVLNRLNWAGLDESYFSHICSYEEYHYAKPNVKYYEELLVKTGLEAKDCIHIGNDVNEDYIPASKLGFNTFLLTDCLINPGNVDISVFNAGNTDDLIRYLDKLCQ